MDGEELTGAVQGPMEAADIRPHERSSIQARRCLLMLYRVHLGICRNVRGVTDVYTDMCCFKLVYTERLPRSEQRWS